MQVFRGSLVVTTALAIGILHASAQGDDPTFPMDGRLKALAGDYAVDCGRVSRDEDSRSADRCVRKASSANRSFYVRYDWAGTDTFGAVGLAGDVNGKVYAVGFDISGWGSQDLGPDVKRYDDGHSIVKPCPTPIRFRSLKAKGLTCLLPDKHMPLNMAPK